MSARVAIAQINPTVGDLGGNRRLISQAVSQASQLGGQVVLFPQGALTGYPTGHLADRSTFQRAAAQQLAELAQHLDLQGTGGAHVVVGSLGTTSAGQPVSTAAVLHQGKVIHQHSAPPWLDHAAATCDPLSPPSQAATTFQAHGARFGLAFGDDLAQACPVPGEPKLDALLVLGGERFEEGGFRHRTALATTWAAKVSAPVVLANLVGGQDNLVFDGGSLVVGRDGALLCQASQFQPDLVLWDLADHSPKLALTSSDEEAIYRAITLGLVDYTRKNGFTKVILGLSGGIDSALVAVIAADALGAENVTGVAMPSAISSAHSLSDAVDLAGRVGLDLRPVPIKDLVEPFNRQLGLAGVAAENIQARVRGMVLMALSNMEGHLVLATGNKSELATGYSTIYGDAVGGFAPIKDLVKSQVWQLARWRNAEATRRGEIKPIPESSITKPPSAELRPDQRDSDSLPEYHRLDPVLRRLVQDGLSRPELLAEGLDPDAVELALRLTDRAEWKRRQYPPGPQVSGWSLDCDRRVPMTNRWQEE